MTRAETDVRVGGRFHVVFHTEDGEEHDVSGIYREVVPNEKLQFTWAWRTMPERESLVTVLIKPDGDGSLLTLIHEQFFDEPARDRHEYGWNGSLNKLEKALAVRIETTELDEIRCHESRSTTHNIASYRAKNGSKRARRISRTRRR